MLARNFFQPLQPVRSPLTIPHQARSHPRYRPQPPYKPLQRNRLDRGPIDRCFRVLFPNTRGVVEPCLLIGKGIITGFVKIVFSPTWSDTAAVQKSGVTGGVPKLNLGHYTWGRKLATSSSRAVGSGSKSNPARVCCLASSIGGLWESQPAIILVVMTKDCLETQPDRNGSVISPSKLSSYKTMCPYAGFC